MCCVYKNHVNMEKLIYYLLLFHTHIYRGTAAKCVMFKSKQLRRAKNTGIDFSNALFGAYTPQQQSVVYLLYSNICSFIAQMMCVFVDARQATRQPARQTNSNKSRCINPSIKYVMTCVVHSFHVVMFIQLS